MLTYADVCVDRQMLAAADELEQELRQQVAIYVSSYYYVCPRTTICVSLYYYTVRIYDAADELEQELRQQVAMCVSSYYYVCPRTTICVSLYY
jgi:transcription initiation factor IIE alpha subunit